MVLVMKKMTNLSFRLLYSDVTYVAAIREVALTTYVPGVHCANNVELNLVDHLPTTSSMI